MNLIIGIPAYNEEAMIKRVLNTLPRKLSGISNLDIVLIDDGSVDKTGTIAKKLGVSVLTHIINRGLGGALKTAFSYAKSKNYDILVTFDADGQHDAKDIPKVILPILNNQADVVIGSRWFGDNNKPFSRYIINRLANIFTYLMYGIWTSDSQSGFRAFNKKAIRQINLITDGMEVSSEIFKEIYRNKLSFTETPINVIYTDYSRKKGQQIQNAPNVLFQLLFRLIK